MSQWRARTISRRYATALDSDPGHIAIVVVALAATGAMPMESSAGTPMNDPPPATALSAPPTSAAAKRKRVVSKRGDRRAVGSWEESERVQQIESCPAKRVLGNRDVRVGIACATLRVDHLNIG